MSTTAFLTLAFLSLAGASWSQQNSAPLSPKTLYYQGWQDDESAPAKSETKPKKTATPKPVTKPVGLPRKPSPGWHQRHALFHGHRRWPALHACGHAR